MEGLIIAHRCKPHKLPVAPGPAPSSALGASEAAAPTGSALSTVEGALRSRLHAHAEYLDAMLGIIPVSKYLHRTQDQIEESGRWNKFHKNKKEQAPKQALKEASKRGKRAKFEDAAKRESTGAVVAARVREEKDALDSERAQRAIVVPEAANKGRKDRKRKAADLAQGAVDPSGSDPSGSEPAGALTELQARLRLKIQAMRAERKAPVESEVGNAAKRTRRETRDKAKKGKAPKKGAASKADKKKGPVPDGLLGPKKEDRVESLVPTVAESINYGVIRVDAPSVAAPTKKGRKKNLQRLLEKAEANQSKLDKISEEKSKWGAMVKRAQGEKVLDDPKLLKKSIKRKEASKRKSAKAWADREKTVSKAKADKQAKRNANLKARADKKVERRLKLKRRAGFEGTKQGFVS